MPHMKTRRLLAETQRPQKQSSAEKHSTATLLGDGTLASCMRAPPRFHRLTCSGRGKHLGKRSGSKETWSTAKLSDKRNSPAKKRPAEDSRSHASVSRSARDTPVRVREALSSSMRAPPSTRGRERARLITCRKKKRTKEQHHNDQPQLRRAASAS